MPLVPARQHSTAFLYESIEDADADKNFIAMGFFVVMRSERHKGYIHLYLITNEHVVADLTQVVARIHLCTGAEEKKRGRLREPDDLASLIIPARMFVTNVEDDLAIAPVTLPEDALVQATPIEDLVQDFRSVKSPDVPFVGVGDEILMLSRIVRQGIHYLKENIQLARFGSVALVPKCEEPFFLTEMRSIAGHSGSPVWVVLPGFNTENGWGICGTPARREHFGMRLLGINRGHLRDYENIVTLNASGEPTPHSRWIAQTNMAIAQVVPAWLIADMLNGPALTERRHAADKSIEGPNTDIEKDAR
jgi:hypothetical protein